MAKPKKKRRVDRAKVTRVVAFVIVFGLLASFFIGAVATAPASAVTITENCVPDIDGDGALNGVDEDVDGDGVVNGLDDDIDGDKLANFDDQDPLTTNCTLDAPLPLEPKEEAVDPGFIAALVIGVLVTIPLAFFVGRATARRRK